MSQKARKFDSVRLSVCGLFALALVTALYVSRPVLLPVILALILTQILRPLHGFLKGSLKLPSFLAAFVIVTSLTSALIAGGYILSGPASQYQKKLDDKEVQKRLKETFNPIKKFHTEIVEVAKKVDTIAEQPVDKKSGGESPKDGDTSVEIDSQPDQGKVTTKVTSPVKKEEATGTVNVQIKENSVSAFYSVVKDLGFHLLSTIVLLFFFLAHGQEMSTRLGEVRGTPELLLEIEREVSGYLFNITLINLGLGLAIGLALGFLGVPNPILWGVMAALLNFIPYAGALIGAGVVTLVSAMEFQSPGMTLAGGSVYLVLSAIEGNIITPSVIGRRFEINPIIVFIWVLAWAAIWGLAGMLIALPILIIFRIVCSKIPSLARLERAITISTSP